SGRREARSSGSSPGSWSKSPRRRSRGPFPLPPAARRDGRRDASAAGPSAMHTRLARFACVGVLVTVIDIALAVAGRLTLGLPVIAADAAAIAVAPSLSWTANRW